VKPKSHKDFKAGIAEEVGVHQSVVDDFLEKAIKRNKSILGNLVKRTYAGFAKSEDVQKDIEQMEKALHQMEQDIINKKEFKKKHGN